MHKEGSPLMGADDIPELPLLLSPELEAVDEYAAVPAPAAQGKASFSSCRGRTKEPCCFNPWQGDHAGSLSLQQTRQRMLLMLAAQAKCSTSQYIWL